MCNRNSAWKNDVLLWNYNVALWKLQCCIRELQCFIVNHKVRIVKLQRPIARYSYVELRTAKLKCELNIASESRIFAGIQRYKMEKGLVLLTGNSVYFSHHLLTYPCTAIVRRNTTLIHFQPFRDRTQRLFARVYFAFTWPCTKGIKKGLYSDIW